MFGSGLLLRAMPKVVFVGGPISFSWATSSPFRSFQVRMSVELTLGL
jgi:hypothetical protein